MRAGRPFGVLGVESFRWYWIATVAYYIGFFGDQLARNWLAYEMTGSALLLGLVVVSQGVPQALLAVIGGTLADRVPKKRLLVASQVLLAAAAVTQSGLLLLHLTQYWHVVGVALVNGVAVGLSLPARLSF
ncbi:MAG: MFS transporter, partial [Chloroflexota bacterium]